MPSPNPGVSTTSEPVFLASFGAEVGGGGTRRKRDARSLWGRVGNQNRTIFRVARSDLSSRSLDISVTRAGTHVTHCDPQRTAERVLSKRRCFALGRDADCESRDEHKSAETLALRGEMFSGEPVSIWRKKRHSGNPYGIPQCSSVWQASQLVRQCLISRDYPSSVSSFSSSATRCRACASRSRSFSTISGFAFFAKSPFSFLSRFSMTPRFVSRSFSRRFR